MDPLIVLVLVIILAVVAVLLILNLYGRMYRKVGPNQALIVYGAGGQRILTGGGTLVIPLLQESKLFSLELMSFDVAPQQNLYTNQGVSVKVEAVTTWALIDRATGRLMRVRPEIAAPFLR